MTFPCKLFAIEGGICSGKTTLIRKLSYRVPLIVVEDYMRDFDQDRIDKLSSTALDDTLPIFVEIEDKRKHNCGTTDRTVCLDRSFLTLVGFRYACLRLGLITKRTSILQQFREATFIMPERIFHLAVPPEERSRRLQRRGDTAMPLIFCRPDFNELLDEFFFFLKDDFDITFVDTSEIAEEGVVAIVLETLAKPIRARPGDSIEAALRLL